MRGLEPPRGYPHTDLNRARLPIPPHPRAGTHCSPGPAARLSTIPFLRRGVVIALAGLVALGAAHFARAGAVARTEVVVTLDRPSLADSVQQSRVLTVRAKATRLDVLERPEPLLPGELTTAQDALARADREHALGSDGALALPHRPRRHRRQPVRRASCRLSRASRALRRSTRMSPTAAHPPRSPPVRS